MHCRYYGRVSEPKSLQDEDPSRKIRFSEGKIGGCFTVQFPAFRDERGVFVKTVQRSIFERHGLEADFVEVFFTTSSKNVLRGMHFQLPPSDHAKLVYCTAGSICDIALDLRVGSETYGEYEVYELTAEANNAVYLCRGIAHGFYVRRSPATIVYHVTSEHDPAQDAGILWSSFDAPWPVSNPVVSARDKSLPTFAHFKSPFRMNTTSPRTKEAR